MKPTIYDFINSKEEKEMRKEFERSAKEIINEKNLYKKPGNKIGIELEVQLVNKDTLNLSSEIIRNSLLEYNSEVFDKELGISQLEIKTPPIKIENNIEELEENITNSINSAKQHLDSNFNGQYGLFLQGSYPLKKTNEIERSNFEKYKLVPNFHNNFKGTHINTFLGKDYKIDVSDAGIIALMNSVQINVEAKDLGDAVDKLNRSLFLGGYIAALNTNARFLNEEDTEIEDSRMISWEKSHDVRLPEQFENDDAHRVGIPDKYYEDIRNYFSRVGSHPFILNEDKFRDNALEIGMGLNWNDTRIKFNRDNKISIVEFRPISTQPTIKENIAAMMMYLGRLEYSQKTKEPVLPIKFAKENRNNALEKGLNSMLYQINKDNKITISPARKILGEEIEKSKIGLIELGYEKNQVDDYLNIMHDRLSFGTPSHKFAKDVYSKNCKCNKDSIKDAIKKNNLVI